MQFPENAIQQRFLRSDISHLAYAVREDLPPEISSLPENGIQLIHWIERLPGEILEAHPHISLLYIHTLLVTHQYDRAKRHLQIVEYNLQCREATERESIQGEIVALRTYLTLHQELTSHYQETFYHLADVIINTIVEIDLLAKRTPVAGFPMAQEPLSKRELEVLSYMAAGMSNQEIAQTLVVAVGTVKRHVNNIYMKFNVHSRIQAVRYAQTHHLLSIL